MRGCMYLSICSSAIYVSCIVICKHYESSCKLRPIVHPKALMLISKDYMYIHIYIYKLCPGISV